MNIKRTSPWLVISIVIALVVIGYIIFMNVVGVPHAWQCPKPTKLKYAYTIAFFCLLALNTGLIVHRIKQGSCPIGSKRATGIGGLVGALAILCPACLVLPLSLFGISLSLSFVAPYVPLMRVVVLLTLVSSAILLIPKRS